MPCRRSSKSARRSSKGSSLYRNILVPLDGSKKSLLALPAARQLAESTGCTVHLLVALTFDKVLFVDRDDTLPHDFGRLSEQQQSMAEAFLQETAAGLQGVNVVTHACRQAPSQAVVAYAKEHEVDLIVMSRKQKSTLTRWLGGSTSDAVLRNAPCSVLIVRPDVSDQQADGQGHER